MNLEESLDCRICLEPDGRRNLIAPCACSGTQKYVHRACLNRWRATREDRAFSKCTECLTTYKMISANMSETEQIQKNRKIKFYLYFTRDVLVCLLFIQAIIVLSSVIIFKLDTKEYLITRCRFLSHPVLFYYLVGLVCFFAFLGIVYLLFQICDKDLAYSCDTCCCPCGRHHNNSCGYCGNYYIIPGGNYHGHSNGCCCCVAPDCSGAPCNCHCPSNCDCNCGGGNDGGGVVVVILLVVLAIFVAIGIFVFVAAGMYYLNQVGQRHAHILHKKGLTEEFIVADLASDASDYQTTGASATATAVYTSSSSSSPAYTPSTSTSTREVATLQRSKMSRGDDIELPPLVWPPMTETLTGPMPPHLQQLQLNNIPGTRSQEGFMSLEQEKQLKAYGLL